jgi:transcriptional regulator with XRE-family HTH domain
MSTVGAVIQQARKQQYLSITQLSIQSGVSEGMIRRLEHHNEAKFHTVVHLARVLKLAPEVLFAAVPLFYAEPSDETL